MKTELLMGNDDPLSPEPNMGQNKDQCCILSLGLHYIDGDCSQFTLCAGFPSDEVRNLSRVAEQLGVSRVRVYRYELKDQKNCHECYDMPSP